MSREFHSFSEFYPYYLAEHINRTCRRLHFVGTSLALLILVLSAFNAWVVLKGLETLDLRARRKFDEYRVGTD